MNEIKRQLTKKLGDTSVRTASVIQKIEEGKKMKRQASKKKSSGLIYVAIASFITILALFFLIEPFANNEPNQLNNADDQTDIVDKKDEEQKPNEDEKPDEEVSTRDYLKKLFKEDGTDAYFIGYGNEFATFKETTNWISDNYVELIVDNGGQTMQKIYRITEDAIVLVYEEPTDIPAVTPTVVQLDAMPVISTLFKAPILDGKTSDGKTITTNVPLTLPFGDFTTIRVEYDEENIHVTKHYAEGFGLVAEYYYMNEEIDIRSLLASINEMPTYDKDMDIEVFNKTTNQTEKYKLDDLPFIDPYMYKAAPDYYKMTYEQKFTSGNKEIGVIQFGCTDEVICNDVILYKENGKLNVITNVWGELGEVKQTEDKEYLVFPLKASEKDDNDYVVWRNQLWLLHLPTMKQYVPTTNEQYFDYPTYPIVSYTLGNKVITLTVADVPNMDFQTIASWQKQANRKTKTITVRLE